MRISARAALPVRIVAAAVDVFLVAADRHTRWLNILEGVAVVFVVLWLIVIATSSHARRAELHRSALNTIVTDDFAARHSAR